MLQKKFSFMPDKLPGLLGNWPEVSFLTISNDSRKFFCNVGEATFGSCKSFQMFSF